MEQVILFRNSGIEKLESTLRRVNPLYLFFFNGENLVYSPNRFDRVKRFLAVNIFLFISRLQNKY